MAQMRHEPVFRISDQSLQQPQSGQPQSGQTQSGQTQSAQTQGGQAQEGQQSSSMTRGSEARGRPLARGQRGTPYLTSPIVDPFTFMRRFAEDIDRMFDDFGMGGGLSPLLSGLPRAGAGQGGALTQGYWRPAVDVVERDKEILVRTDLPGLKADDVRVNIEDDVLTIQGERRDERDDAREGAYVSERVYGYFRRSIELPEGVDPNRVEARFENGVLEIHIPTPERKGHNVAIRSGAGTKAIGEGDQGGRDRTGTEPSS